MGPVSSSLSDPLTERRAVPDRCPGALQLHQAADGPLARVRVPGGRLTRAQWTALTALAADHGDGHLELTSRANLQVRGVRDEVALADGLAAAGLLPSATHERVRNIVASPLTGLDSFADLRGVIADLDRELIADPMLAQLPGRFLFALDGGRGDVAALDADVTIVAAGDVARVLLGGADHGLAVPLAGAVRVALIAARAFLALRILLGDPAWRIAELRSPEALVRAVRAAAADDLVPVPAPIEPVPTGLIGPIGDDAVGVLVPLGRLTPAQLAAIDADEIVVTPWRGIVLVGPADRTHGALSAAGLETDPATPWAGVTTCAGRPGCAKALADVRADAMTRTARRRRSGGPALPVHWAGCERGCGSPAGRHVRVLATASGTYEVERVDGRTV